MKKYLLLVVFVLGSFSIFSQEKKEQQEEVTTYYLIRHAEKNRSDKTEKDPFLTFQGHKRAEHWAKVFSTVKFDIVYTTDYNRTKETASPTANAKNLPLFKYDPRKMYNEAFINHTKGKTVLVVGHSNTTPFFANKILGKDTYKQIDDSNNNNLYIVTVTKEGATSVLLNIDFNSKK